MSQQYNEIDADPYIAVSTDKLINGEPLPFGVFIKDMGIVVPLLDKGTVYDGVAYNALLERGLQNVYVRTTEAHDLYKYLSKFHDKGDIIPDPETFKRYLIHKDQYYVIDRTLLLSGTKVFFPIHILHKYGLRTLLPATETAPLVVNSDVLNVPGDIAIDAAHIPLYHDYINSLLTADDTPEFDKIRIKTIAIKENSKVVIKGFLEDPRSGEKIKQSVTMVNKLVDCILDNTGTISDLLSLRIHDYYTYTHSVNVAVLSVGLGMASGLKRDEIEQLGIGAMMHDIGKSCISVEIINKPGKLSDDEYKIIKTHVIEGEKILRMHKDIPKESFDAVIQHHERMTGRGYPHSRKEREITPFGRITSIVDCYDALTTIRPYHTARTPFTALSVLTKEAGDYDADILKAFIKMLGTIKA